MTLTANTGRLSGKIDNHAVCLSSKEFDVLYMLYSNPDVTFTKEQIFEAVWHEPSVGCCHAVENTVFQIRKKCKVISENTEFITTVVGYGYKFSYG
ncbi:winged helix-turn-helix domain-containing protein [Oscillospiraceae bacterium 42-9]